MLLLLLAHLTPIDRCVMLTSTTHEVELWEQATSRFPGNAVAVMALKSRMKSGFSYPNSISGVGHIRLTWGLSGCG